MKTGGAGGSGSSFCGIAGGSGIAGGNGIAGGLKTGEVENGSLLNPKAGCELDSNSD